MADFVSKYPKVLFPGAQKGVEAAGCHVVSRKTGGGGGENQGKFL